MSDETRSRVMVVGRFYRGTFGEHLASTLEAMGHRVVRYEAGIRERIGASVLMKRVDQVRRRLHDLGGNLSALREREFGRMLRTARDERVDLLVALHDYLRPREVERFKDATGAKAVLWFPDAVVYFGKMYFLDAPYDHLFFKDPYLVWRMTRMLDREIHYLPECCNPRVHVAAELTEEDRRLYGCDITTAGNLHAYRAAVFSQLQDYHVRIWGNPAPLWLRSPAAAMAQNRWVAHEEKAKAFRAAKVVLNNMHPGEIWGLNARAFEAAGVGAFQLVDNVPGLPQLFEDGKEIVSFESMEDLRAKLDHYLARDDERAAIAAAGRERALRDHTYEHRVRLLLATLRGEARGFELPSIALKV